jgi:hypothetical protein
MVDKVKVLNTLLRIILPLNLTENLRASEMKTDSVNAQMYDR